MNSQDFINAGYRQFKETGIRNAEYLLQKAICDGDGIKYYLDVYAYFLQGEEVFEAQVQFSKNLKPYNVTFWLFGSVEEVEKVFEEMWEKMNFDHKEREQQPSEINLEKFSRF